MSHGHESLTLAHHSKVTIMMTEAPPVRVTKAAAAAVTSHVTVAALSCDLTENSRNPAGPALLKRTYQIFDIDFIFLIFVQIILEELFKKNALSQSLISAYCYHG